MALSFLKDIVPSNPSVPSHANVLITPSEGQLELRGMDTNKTAKIVISAVTNGELPFLIILSRPFYPFISLASKTNDVFRFKVTTRKLTIILEDDSETNLSLSDVDSFPLMSSGEYNTNIEVDPVDFVDSLNMSVFTDSPYLNLTMYHIFTDNGKLKLETTNSMAGGKTIIQETNENINLGVPSAIQRPLKKMVGLEDEWTLSINDKTLKVSGVNWEVVFTTMVDEYYDISNIYNNSNINLLQLNRAEVINEVALLSIVAEDNNIHINVKSGIITLSVKGGNNKESGISIPMDEPDNRVTLHLSEFRKILSMLNDEYFYMQLGNIEPVLFYEDTQRIYFTIPLSN